MSEEIALDAPVEPYDPVATRAEIDAKEAANSRGMLRGQIALKAGDTASLLGTTADGAQLAIYGLAVLVGKLSTANSLSEVREAAEPFAALSAEFLQKVESGEVVLPFMLKGIASVVTDIETRATAVSTALLAVESD